MWARNRKSYRETPLDNMAHYDAYRPAESKELILTVKRCYGGGGGYVIECYSARIGSYKMQALPGRQSPLSSIT